MQGGIYSKIAATVAYLNLPAKVYNAAIVKTFSLLGILMLDTPIVWLESL